MAAEKNNNWEKIVSKNARLNSVYRGEMKEVQELYDSLAQNLDKNVKDLGYIGPEVGAKKLVEFLKQHQFSTDCKILDVGSGTGAVGKWMRELEFTNIDALDPSEKSVEVAKSKGIYKKFFMEFLGPGKELSIPSDTYDAAICIGVFIPLHMKAEARAMDEMVRVVKPGGLICFSIREDVMFDKEYGHEAKMAELCENKSWKLLSKTQEAYIPEYKECYMFAYQVL